MKDNISVKLDYLSARLTPGFNSENLMDFAESPLVDTDTGQKVGIRLQHDQFRPIVITNGTEVASFYRGGEAAGWELVQRHNLPVTRIDICVDIPVGSSQEATELYAAYKLDLGEYFDSKEYKVKRMHWEGAHEAENGAEGSTFFSRSGEKQLRVYHKLPYENRTNGGHVVRLEWQCRGEIAKTLYQHINRSEKRWEVALIEAWQSLNMQFLGGDFFELDENIELEAIELPRKQKHSTEGYEAWIMSKIAPSLYKFFKDTGKNLAEELVLEIDRLVLANGEIEGRRPSTPMERKRKNLAIRRENELQRLMLQRQLAEESNRFIDNHFDVSDATKALLPVYEPERESED